MSKIIFDTSFLVGLIDKRDKFHNICVTIYDLLEERKFKGIIFDCVVGETISVLARRAFEQKRMNEFIDIFNTALNFIKKEKISWIYPEIIELYEKILEIVRSSNGKLNFHDALILLSAQENNIPYIASFDKDFDGVEGLVRIKDKKDLE